jgi:hypothetical protein
MEVFLQYVILTTIGAAEENALVLPPINTHTTVPVPVPAGRNSLIYT